MAGSRSASSASPTGACGPRTIRPRLAHRRGVPIARLLAGYESACARSRQIAMSSGLGAPSRKELDDGRPFTLRYALLHLIEETSRHNGHLDILREIADGVTGP